MSGDLLVLAGVWTLTCLAFVAAGAVCEPGGLWDRLCVRLGLDDTETDGTAAGRTEQEAA